MKIEAEVAVSRILQKPPNKVVTKKPKKKKTKVETARDDSDHYRLNLGDIPFIAGKVSECLFELKSGTCVYTIAASHFDSRLVPKCLFMINSLRWKDHFSA